MKYFWKACILLTALSLTQCGSIKIFDNSSVTTNQSGTSNVGNYSSALNYYSSLMNAQSSAYQGSSSSFSIVAGQGIYVFTLASTWKDNSISVYIDGNLAGVLTKYCSAMPKFRDACTVSSYTSTGMHYVSAVGDKGSSWFATPLTVNSGAATYSNLTY